MQGLLSPTRAFWRLSLFLLWTVVVVPPYAALMGARLPCRWLARAYWRGVALAIDLEVVAHGQPSADRPLLILSNHTSYLDIVALGSLVDGGFVAKSEVSTWPGFGTIARLGRTVFVERKRASSRRGGDAIRARLAEGEPLILFPEGTSNDGNRVLPFKSALLTVAEPPRRRDTPAPSAPDPVAPGPVVVQPVSLAYTRIDGVPVGYAWRPFYAWYGDMDLASHLWAVLGLGRVTAEVVFHAPLRADGTASRKALARHCERVVSAGTAALLAGHGPGVAARLGIEAATEALPPPTSPPMPPSPPGSDRAEPPVEHAAG
ncbi:lysophospholipid acyltransferase family protein [Roseospira visakhapatnamensis]|uniref:1-acyl-sn-glycerol-3-phosphate acyltransferase n=1 Tax=Roseospira visakhapatnamensis TaxID=390880 RepID=A0A7W6W8Z8_9PROT|nr:lysophospholipid acyltransferase family protein [Roseospira visakhapatnamensis]MBB4265565.1 1-acyl-sn-glycerol-3-phosphate acyltransferase [Roseospira visakhapatnamensis]